MECRNTICQIELTNICGSACWYCRNAQMTRKRGMMDLVLVKEICKRVQGRQDFMFLHYYGESLNHPQFIEACKILDKYCIKPGVFTCGAKLTPKMIQEIADSPLCYISVTMNRFAPLKQVEALREACGGNVYIQVSLINTPKNDIKYTDLTSKELGAWAKEVSDRTGKPVVATGLSYEFPEKVNGKLACSFKTKGGECKIRLENSYCVLWDGSLVDCIKDYEGETSLGHVLDVLDKVEYKDTKCPY